MIVYLPSQPNAPNANMRLFGEFDSRIDEIELYDSEEFLLSITPQKEQHAELTELIKEFVKYHHKLGSMKQGL